MSQSQNTQQQTATWYPSLTGLNLPSQLTSAIQQSYALTYAQRDVVNQIASGFQRMLQYGTHLARVQFNPKQAGAPGVPQGALFWEVDRPSTFYQARLNQNTSSQQWYWAGGIFVAPLANRPTDLIAAPADNDNGFLFRASDTQTLYQWDGTTWNVV